MCDFTKISLLNKINHKNKIVQTEYKINYLIFQSYEILHKNKLMQEIAYYFPNYIYTIYLCV